MQNYSPPPAPNFAAPGQQQAPQPPAQQGYNQAPTGYGAPPPGQQTQQGQGQQGYGQPSFSAPPADMTNQGQQGYGQPPLQQQTQQYGAPQGQSYAPPGQQTQQGYQPAQQQYGAPAQQQQTQQYAPPQNQAQQFAPPQAQQGQPPPPAQPAQYGAPQGGQYRPPGTGMPGAQQQLPGMPGGGQAPPHAPGYQQPGGPSQMGGKMTRVGKARPPLEGTYIARLIGVSEGRGKAPPKLEFVIEDPNEAAKAGQGQPNEQGREIEVPLWPDERSPELMVALNYGPDTWIDDGQYLHFPTGRMVMERPLAQLTLSAREGTRPGQKFQNVDSVRRVG